jgi:hypothetical protein
VVAGGLLCLRWAGFSGLPWRQAVRAGRRAGLAGGGVAGRARLGQVGLTAQLLAVRARPGAARRARLAAVASREKSAAIHQRRVPRARLG